MVVGVVHRWTVPFASNEERSDGTVEVDGTTTGRTTSVLLSCRAAMRNGRHQDGLQAIIGRLSLATVNDPFSFGVPSLAFSLPKCHAKCPSVTLLLPAAPSFGRSGLDLVDVVV